MSTTTAGRRSTAKVVGSIAVVGAAVAVAGLGTFGQFTDSTSAVEPSVDTGVLDIDVSIAGMSAPVPVSTVNLLPGDKIAVPLDLRNGGDVDLASLTLDSYATTHSLLDTDTTHGLQLKVETCDAGWVGSGSDYSCAGTAVPLYTGPVATKSVLTGARSLQHGKTDHLLATVSFPSTGGDTMQNQSSALEFVFTAAQRSGAAR
jgi:hypothetical protein